MARNMEELNTRRNEQLAYRNSLQQQQYLKQMTSESHRLQKQKELAEIRSQANQLAQQQDKEKQAKRSLKNEMAKAYSQQIQDRNLQISAAKNKQLQEDQAKLSHLKETIDAENTLKKQIKSQRQLDMQEEINQKRRLQETRKLEQILEQKREIEEIQVSERLRYQKAREIDELHKYIYEQQPQFKNMTANRKIQIDKWIDKHVMEHQRIQIEKEKMDKIIREKKYMNLSNTLKAQMVEKDNLVYRQKLQSQKDGIDMNRNIEKNIQDNRLLLEKRKQQQQQYLNYLKMQEQTRNSDKTYSFQNSFNRSSRDFHSYLRPNIINFSKPSKPVSRSVQRFDKLVRAINYSPN